MSNAKFLVVAVCSDCNLEHPVVCELCEEEFATRHEKDINLSICDTCYDFILNKWLKKCKDCDTLTMCMPSNFVEWCKKAELDLDEMNAYTAGVFSSA